MGCVRTIITPDDQQQIHWHIEQFSQRILSLLCRAADGIEKSEILLRKLGPVSIGNRPSKAPLHFFRFAAEHGGLICDASGLQMHVRIESWCCCLREHAEKRGFVTAVADV